MEHGPASTRCFSARCILVNVREDARVAGKRDKDTEFVFVGMVGDEETLKQRVCEKRREGESERDR